MFVVELWGTPWLFFHSMLPLQGAQVLFLVRELRSHGFCSRAKKKKENLWRVEIVTEKNIYAVKIKTIPRKIVDIQRQTLIIEIKPHGPLCGRCSP